MHKRQNQFLDCSNPPALFQQVRAYNDKGQSNFSDEVTAITRVDRIPAPHRVTFDPESHVLNIYVGPTCLQLVNIVILTSSPIKSECI